MDINIGLCTTRWRVEEINLNGDLCFGMNASQSENVVNNPASIFNEMWIIPFYPNSKTTDLFPFSKMN